MTSPWKPQNGSHRDLEISLRTRDFHIPTAPPRFLVFGQSGQITCQTEADSSLVNNRGAWCVVLGAGCCAWCGVLGAGCWVLGSGASPLLQEAHNPVTRDAGLS
jgi:hypothetical protein